MNEFEKKAVVDLQINSEEATKRLSEVYGLQENLRASTKRLTDANKELSKNYEANVQTIEANNLAITQNKVQQGLLSKETIFLSRTIQQNDKITKSATGSIEQQSAQVSLLTKRYNALSAEERRSEVGKELRKQIDDLTDSLKTNATQLEKQKLNIGNYPSAFGDAIKSVNVFGVNVGEMSEKLGSGAKGAKSFIGGIMNVKGALTALAAIPIVAFLVGLVALLKKTQAGQDFLQKGLAATEAVVDVLVSKVIDFSKSVVEAFSKPGELLESFKTLLKDLAEKQLANFLSGIQGIGKAFKLLFEGEFKAAFKTAGESLLKLNPASAIIEKVGEKVLELGQELFVAGKAAFDLEGQIIAIERANKQLALTISKLNSEYEIQQTIADDATRSFAEREKAAERSRQIAAKAAKLQTDIARNELSILNQQFANKKKLGLLTDEQLDQQREATLKVIELENAYQKTLIDNEKQRRELVQDRLEKNLDILLDYFDNQKNINEKLLQDDEKFFSERQKLLDETVRLGEEAFKKQIETVQLFTDKRIDANDLIATSDAVLLNEKIRGLGLSEIVEGRLLEVLRERRNVTQDLAQDQKDLNQKQADEFKATLDANKNALDDFIAQLRQKSTETFANDKDAYAYARRNEEIERQSLAVRLAQLDEFQKKTIENTKLTEKEKNELTEKIGNERVAISQRLNEQDIETAKRTQQERQQIADAQLQVAGSVVDGLSSAFQLLAQNEEEANDLAKVAAVAQLTIDTAKSISSTIAGATAAAAAGGPAAPFLVAGYITTGIGTVLSAFKQAKELLNFELGGDVSESMDKANGIPVGGKRHNQGGTTYVGQDGNAFEVEEGEKIFVLKRHDSGRIRSLSNKNVLRGGVPWYEFGGSVQAAQAVAATVPRDTTAFQDTITRIIQRPSIVKVSDINRVSTKQAQAKASSRLK